MTTKKIGKRFATCTKCKERFEAPSQEVMVTCTHCGERFNSIRLNSERYIQPGTYLYAFITVDEDGKLKGRSTCTDPELSPEEMRQIAMESLKEGEGDDT